MNFGNILEIVIVLFIISTLGLLFWKGGASNPVGTAKLQTDVGRLRSDVDGIGGRLEHLENSVASVGDVDRLEEKLHGEAQKIDKALGLLDRVDEELSSLSKSILLRNQVTEALATSVRSLSDDLKAHQADVSKRLEDLGALTERVADNRDEIRHIRDAYADMSARQSQMAEHIAATAADARHTRATVDRIMAEIVRKGMNS
ncbi:MAG: hypothetical protein COW16_10485 [Sphingomonadales bacterium CG12_big_fil_rev_8_21_14_0_65_65_10]|nr:MAG: hypothetical protein COW16_10485 [Sphingomonadales bacterium CG12_big_fil_rev_8_21_14_0_65_65_10]